MDRFKQRLIDEHERAKAQLQEEFEAEAHDSLQSLLQGLRGRCFMHSIDIQVHARVAYRGGCHAGRAYQVRAEEET